MSKRTTETRCVRFGECGISGRERKTNHIAGTFVTPIFNFSNGSHIRIERIVGSLGSVRTFDAGLAVRLQASTLSQKMWIHGNSSD